MKERFDDEKWYGEESQSFGRIAIRNYREVLREYSFKRYQKRFRERAASNALASGQRPKLDENQFATLMGKLADGLNSREADPLSNPVNREAARRLLIFDDLEEDED